MCYLGCTIDTSTLRLFTAVLYFLKCNQELQFIFKDNVQYLQSNNNRQNCFENIHERLNSLKMKCWYTIQLFVSTEQLIM